MMLREGTGHSQSPSEDPQPDNSPGSLESNTFADIEDLPLPDPFDNGQGHHEMSPDLDEQIPRAKKDVVGYIPTWGVDWTQSSTRSIFKLGDDRYPDVSRAFDFNRQPHSTALDQVTLTSASLSLLENHPELDEDDEDWAAGRPCRRLFDKSVNQSSVEDIFELID
jgi:hypothetical protein